MCKLVSKLNLIMGSLAQRNGHFMAHPPELQQTLTTTIAGVLGHQSMATESGSGAVAGKRNPRGYVATQRLGGVLSSLVRDNLRQLSPFSTALSRFITEIFLHWCLLPQLSGWGSFWRIGKWEIINIRNKR